MIAVKLTPVEAPTAEIDALAAVPMLPPTLIVPEVAMFPVLLADCVIDATWIGAMTPVLLTLVSEKFADAPLAPIEADAPVPRMPPVLVMDAFCTVTGAPLIAFWLIAPKLLDPIATDDPISDTLTEAEAPRAEMDADDAGPSRDVTLTVAPLTVTAGLRPANGVFWTSWETVPNCVPVTDPALPMAETPTLACAPDAAIEAEAPIPDSAPPDTETVVTSTGL